ncbi:CemA family protein [Gloeothece citriformis PCC 7424]|uniref:CemA family protein n=1 Tax=Gloeothece citriformis (strain PCC 7424) TaxID=65393 RepID=B7K7W1_GLOC7|nr:proton extrusion protein PcxA [Gloeothece citriformis]ACK71157.1 CemA family protein [Gloeothece citriformis PCC 7424]
MSKSPSFFHQVKQWLNKRSWNALDQAYTGAKTIKMIENQHFEGQKISPETAKGKSLYDYFKSLLDRELLQIRWNLSQFNWGNFYQPLNQSEQLSSQETEILSRLKFIESVISKYRNTSDNFFSSTSLSSPPQNLPINPPYPIVQNNNTVPSSIFPPRSSPLFEVSQKLTPEYEQEVIQQLRNLRQERKIAIRFLILLVVVPVLVQFLSKNLIYSPLLNWKFVDRAELTKIEISQEVSEKFFNEFSYYKEVLEIQELLGIRPELSPEKKRELLREKAIEMGKEAAYETLNGFKNLLSDLTSLAAFTLMIYIFRRQFTILRSFLSRYFLGLSDVTKVFIFILLTDMFVGFHSAEGWEVILESTLDHFGLPENHNLIFIFIATVPVILDSIFKLLIFNYFTRKSPTAVAVLEKMQQ